MATFKRFEDIEAWQKARMLSKKIFNISRQGSFAKDFKFRDQINDSSGSIMDNIAEGYERGGKAEFINFLTISKGSCGELKSQLHRALDRDYITRETFDELYSFADEIAKMIGGLVVYLNESEIRGPKYKNRIL